MPIGEPNLFRAALEQTSEVAISPVEMLAPKKKKSKEKKKGGFFANLFGGGDKKKEKGKEKPHREKHHKDDREGKEAKPVGEGKRKENV
jgi:hypothetical protein